MTKYCWVNSQYPYEYTPGQYDWCDFRYTGTTVHNGEIKVRHVYSTSYGGETFIEIDKWDEITGHTGTNLIIFFKDCIKGFSWSQLTPTRMGICKNCPDEYAPGKWRTVDKYGAFLDTSTAKTYRYEDLWGKGAPDFVNNDPNAKTRCQQ